MSKKDGGPSQNTGCPLLRVFVGFLLFIVYFILFLVPDLFLLKLEGTSFNQKTLHSTFGSYSYLNFTRT